MTPHLNANRVLCLSPFVAISWADFRRRHGNSFFSGKAIRGTVVPRLDSGDSHPRPSSEYLRM